MGEGQSKIGEDGAAAQLPDGAHATQASKKRKHRTPSLTASKDSTKDPKQAKLKGKRRKSLIARRPSAEDALNPSSRLRDAKKRMLSRSRTEKPSSNVLELSQSKACLQLNRDGTGKITAEISGPLSANVKRRNLILERASSLIAERSIHDNELKSSLQLAIDDNPLDLDDDDPLAPMQEEGPLTARMAETEQAISDALNEFLLDDSAEETSERKDKSKKKKKKKKKKSHDRRSQKQMDQSPESTTGYLTSSQELEDCEISQGGYLPTPNSSSESVKTSKPTRKSSLAAQPSDAYGVAPNKKDWKAEAKDAKPAGKAEAKALTKKEKLKKPPLPEAGSGYLMAAQPISEGSDDDEDESSDDIDWSALDRTEEESTEDDDADDDEEADATESEAASPEAASCKMGFSELLDVLTSLTKEEMKEIGESLTELNPDFVAHLSEAVEDHLALKRAIEADVDSDASSAYEESLDWPDSDSDDDDDEKPTPLQSSGGRPTSLKEALKNAPMSAKAPEVVELPRPKESDLRESIMGVGEALSSVSHTCDWNARFQMCIDSLKLFGQIQQQRNAIYQELSNLAQDFIHCAKTYGRIIISEVETPLKMKTIAPLSDIGGFAGGDKYIVNNILFKFATDSNGLFDNEEAAIKVAGHDLKGLIAYFNLGIADLHFPLMALVDYLGYRLIAMSVLPISSNTICYGSSDGARTVHNSDEGLSAKMQLSSKLLNVKPHKVGLTKKESKVLYSAGDLEGHHLDNKYYLLDFSRSFPPSTYCDDYLFRLLRPEFVKTYRKPLCSDAYSGFVDKHSPKEHIAEVEEATEHLLTVTIPAFAKQLSKVTRMRQLRKDLKVRVHEAGINLRYLGLVRKHVDSADVKLLILMEMIARVIKHKTRFLMREQMKKFKLPLDHSCRETLTSYMNLVFGTSPESNEHFDKVILPKLQANFVDPLSEEELQIPLKSMLSPENLCDLFQSVSNMCNLIWTPSSTIEFSNNPEVYNIAKPFDTTDFAEIGVSVRHLNIVALAQGYVLKNKAREMGKGIHSGRLCKIALEKFKEALSHNPGDKRALRELADVYHLVGDLENAQRHYQRAIDADPQDANILFKYAVFLEESLEKLSEAEEYYLRTLEADVRHDHCMQRYGHFLESQGKPDEAEEFFIRASQIRACGGSRTLGPSQTENSGHVFIF